MVTAHRMCFHLLIMYNNADAEEILDQDGEKACFAAACVLLSSERGRWIFTDPKAFRDHENTGSDPGWPARIVCAGCGRGK
jgi:hypothetical protein